MSTASEIRKQIAKLEAALRAAEEAERKASLAGDANLATALLAAMRQCYKDIEVLFPGTFEGGVWAELTPQAWPRDTRFKRAADLSESEVHSARERGKNAVLGLK
jgi:hypothetical protein